MRENFLYDFAIRSVKVRANEIGGYSVVYWSPTMRDYWSAENLTAFGAAEAAEKIKTGLALEWGSPAYVN